MGFATSRKKMDRRRFLQTLGSVIGAPKIMSFSSPVGVSSAAVSSSVLSLSDAFSLYRMVARRNMIVGQESCLSNWEKLLYEDGDPTFVALQLNSIHMEVYNFKTSELHYSRWIGVQPNSYFERDVQTQSYAYIFEILKTSPYGSQLNQGSINVLARYFGNSSQQILDNLKEQVEEIERVDNLARQIASRLSIDLDNDTIDTMCQKVTRYYKRNTLCDIASRHNALCGPVPHGYVALHYAKQFGCETRNVWQGRSRSEIVALQPTYGKAIRDRLHL
jgi:hypothetical protein